ncbi:MKRN2 opposite strand protein-like [Diretmus argenteus]
MLRFSHCGNIIYTFDRLMTSRRDLPSNTGRCPVCRDVMRLGLLDAPVSVPSPFINGHQAPCCFLIASQQGALQLREQNDSELHVGISNSEGVVFSYTESGVQRQQQDWEQSLAITLVAPGNLSLNFRKYWDRQLEKFASLDTWTPQRFAEDRDFGSCCYGFALSFINQLRRSEVTDPISRDAFTSQYVLPRMKTASKFLSVYQHISQHGCT